MNEPCPTCRHVMVRRGVLHASSIDASCYFTYKCTNKLCMQNNGSHPIVVINSKFVAPCTETCRRKAKKKR